MPHTSRKKKKGPSRKRLEITDDEGWTHVVTTGRSRAEWYQNWYTTLEEREDRSRFCSRNPWVMPDDLTCGQLEARYRAIEAKWKASESWAGMEAALRNTILPNIAPIQSCLLLGSGSLCGLLEGWADRSNVSLYQLAAFKSVVDVIAETNGAQPAVYAQEPWYNRLDEELLETLQMRKVDHPAAFELMTRQSFAFCPGAEQFVVKRTLRRDPALYLGGYLEVHRGIHGFLQSGVISVAYEVFDSLEQVAQQQQQQQQQQQRDTADPGPGHLMNLDDIERDGAGKFDGAGRPVSDDWIQQRRRDYEPDAREIQFFLDGRGAAPVPDLAVDGCPIWGTWFSWRPRSADGDGEAEDEDEESGDEAGPDRGGGHDESRPGRG